MQPIPPILFSMSLPISPLFCKTFEMSLRYMQLDNAIELLNPDSSNLKTRPLVPCPGTRQQTRHLLCDSYYKRAFLICPDLKLIFPIFVKYSQTLKHQNAVKQTNPRNTKASACQKGYQVKSDMPSRLPRNDILVDEKNHGHADDGPHQKIHKIRCQLVFHVMHPYPEIFQALKHAPSCKHERHGLEAPIIPWIAQRHVPLQP